MSTCDASQIAALQKKYALLRIVPQTSQLQVLHTRIRDGGASREDFVFFADRLIRLIVEEGLAHLPVEKKAVPTPTGVSYEGVVPNTHICGVSIMRAGESMEKGLRDTCRGVRIGKILIQRDENTSAKTPDERYNYAKVPKDIAERKVLLLDPMLATAGSAIRAMETLVHKFGCQAKNIIFLNVVSAPEGIERFMQMFPETQVITSAVDSYLNDAKYIVPGLGDFGDRYFGSP